LTRRQCIINTNRATQNTNLEPKFGGKKLSCCTETVQRSAFENFLKLIITKQQSVKLHCTRSWTLGVINNLQQKAKKPQSRLSEKHMGVVSLFWGIPLPLQHNVG